MECQKITNLVDTTSDSVPRFIIKIWIEVHDHSGSAENRYRPSKQIRFKTSMLQSDLCDYSDAYIVKWAITVTDPDNNLYDKKLSFKNFSKFNSNFNDNAEELDIVMPMYNFIEYSKNYWKTSGTLWNCYRDEPNSDAVGNINYSICGSKSFGYKTSITGRLEGNNTEKEVEIVVPWKHLSSFWRTLDMSLINCEWFLTLTWSEKRKATGDADPNANPEVAAVNDLANATFKITNTNCMYQ